MGSKMKQCVRIKFCVVLGKFTTEIPSVLHEAIGEHALSRTAVFE
jgi:hypothetical protein